MPLVDMGLVRHAQAIGSVGAATGRAGGSLRQRDDEARVLRCVAGFYLQDHDASTVADTLGARFGLRPTQLTVIRPTGLTREGLARMRRRWQCLRPPQDAGRQAVQRWRLVRAVATGLAAGGLGAMVGLLAVQASGVAAGALSWLVPGLWAGAIAGAVTSALAPRRRPGHRFDRVVERRLQRGFSVVVAHGLGEADEAPVLAYLQATSHSWAAEAPTVPTPR